MTDRIAPRLALPKHLSFEEVCDIVNAAFGHQNRVIVGLDIRLVERRYDGTVAEQVNTWGQLDCGSPAPLAVTTRSLPCVLPAGHDGSHESAPDEGVSQRWSQR